MFSKDPVNLLRLFRLSDEHNAKIHPDALNLVTRSLDLIDDDLRRNPDANRIFLEILTSRRDPEGTLRGAYSTLGLGDFEPLERPLADYLSRISGYRTNRYTEFDAFVEKARVERARAIRELFGALWGSQSNKKRTGTP